MNEYRRPIVATIISVFRSLILSKTNHVAASITRPTIIRNKNTSAPIMRAQSVLILSLIILPATIGRSYRPAKSECPDTVALTNRFPGRFALCGAFHQSELAGRADDMRRRGLRARLSAYRCSRIEAEASRAATVNPGTTCLGLRFAYSAPRQSPRGRRPGAACGAALGPGP